MLHDLGGLMTYFPFLGTSQQIGGVGLAHHLNLFQRLLVEMLLRFNSTKLYPKIPVLQACLLFWSRCVLAGETSHGRGFLKRGKQKQVLFGTIILQTGSPYRTFPKPSSLPHSGGCTVELCSAIVNVSVIVLTRRAEVRAGVKHSGRGGETHAETTLWGRHSGPAV